MSPIHICITKNSVDRAAYPPRENWKVERVYVSRELSKEKKKIMSISSIMRNRTGNIHPDVSYLIVSLDISLFPVMHE